jgi:hypothetical protein
MVDGLNGLSDSFFSFVDSAVGWAARRVVSSWLKKFLLELLLLEVVLSSLEAGSI